MEYASLAIPKKSLFKIKWNDDTRNIIHRTIEARSDRSVFYLESSVIEEIDAEWTTRYLFKMTDLKYRQPLNFYCDSISLNSKYC